ncbi:MAG: DUF2851 family protein [Muribaculaceae bacterium]|nr:DUF2851 family protein [Muribaculaceae bacterium]
MEILLHYIWQNRLLGMPLMLDDGRQVRILRPGRHNEDAGPDFAGAVLQIGDSKWAGNVEIHMKASDWFRHGHDKDMAYDNIILHAVAVNDTKIYRRNGEVIPQATVNIPANFYYSFASLNNAIKGIRCASNIAFIPNIRQQDWLETLAFERLQHKGERIISYHSIRSGDWEQAVFITLARALGFGLNGVPFELLAKSLPLKYIYHHSDSLQQIEALLFGQAGMLVPGLYPHDAYYQQLVAEYDFLRRKYSLTPISRELWKYSRTRPANFPHRRIAMLAQYLYSGINLTASLIDARGIYDKLERIFRQDLQQYWANHDAFGAPEVRRSYSLSRAAIESLMINVAAPFYFAYARLTGDYPVGEYAIDLLTSIDPERNSIITAWENAGIKADSALRSQALIHLRNEYCDRARCLECRFGYHILRRNAAPPDMHALSPDASPEPDTDVRTRIPRC